MNKKSPFLSNDEKLISNDVGFVIFDKHPITLGHSLIIPNRIYADYFESTSEEIVGLNDLMNQARDYLKKRFSPDGFNIGWDIGKVAGQNIQHTHLHIIPRYLKDSENNNTGMRSVL